MLNVVKSLKKYIAVYFCLLGCPALLLITPQIFSRVVMCVNVWFSPAGLLGSRLEAAEDAALQAQACLCYICAGTVEQLVAYWAKAQDSSSPLALQVRRDPAAHCSKTCFYWACLWFCVFACVNTVWSLKKCTVLTVLLSCVFVGAGWEGGGPAESCAESSGWCFWYGCTAGREDESVRQSAGLTGQLTDGHILPAHQHSTGDRQKLCLKLCGWSHKRKPPW